MKSPGPQVNFGWLVVVLLLGISFAFPSTSTQGRALPNRHCDAPGGFCRSVNSHILEAAEQETAKKALENEDFCGTRLFKPKRRIVGGQEAYYGQFPWQAMINTSTYDSGEAKRFQCGGTLISDEIVITAAHCIKFTSVDRYEVTLGRHYLANGMDDCREQKFSVTRIEVHPKFNKRHLSNDVAILWIRNKYGQTARFSDYVIPACLPDPDEKNLYKTKTLGTVSGWGLLEESGEVSSPTLQFVSVPILESSVCMSAYNRCFIRIASFYKQKNFKPF